MQGKKILITGASSGLGKALSHWFSELGADLFLLSRSQDKLEQLQSQLSAPCHIHAVDFQNKAAIDQTLSTLHNLTPNVIVHCAGGGLKLKNPLLTRDDFEQLMNLNLNAVVQINQHFIPSMMNAKQGVVIHVGSTAGSAAHGSVGYNTAKAALAAYVRSLGRALAHTGIVITGISPGGFLADGNNMSRFQQDKPNEFADYLASLPAKRMIEVKEFFHIIKTLCDQTSGLFCGSMIPVDAGEGMSYTHE